MRRSPIAGVVEGWKRRSIVRNPEYQRGQEWSVDQQRLLIDSAFRGYPLPRFYFCLTATTDPFGNPATSLEVIDGLQRILSFERYLDDKFALFDPAKSPNRFPRAVAAAPCGWAGLRYSELPEELRERLAAMRLPVVVIDRFDSPEELRDLFIRLQAGTALTRQQVRDAWPGRMTDYISRIGGRLDLSPRFAFLSALDGRSYRRDDEDELDDPYHDGRQTAAQLMRLFLDRKRGLPVSFVNARALDDLYHTETDFDARGLLAVEFERVLGALQSVVELRAPRTSGGTRRKSSKARVFAAFLTLTDLAGTPEYRLDRELGRIASAYWDLEWPVVAGKTTARTTIQAQFKWFEEQVLRQDAVSVDPRRWFNDVEKSAILALQRSLCSICGQSLEHGGVEFDHVVAWIQGGRTVVENGHAFHPGCEAMRRDHPGEAA